MIYPKCKVTGPNAISEAMSMRFDGYVVPCCHMNSQHAMDKLSLFLGESVKNIHITSGRSIDQINTSREYQRIEESWNTTTPFSICKNICGRANEIGPDKHRTGTNFIQKTLNKDKHE
jgi:hypothetical protein|tara:strand:+ start:691 stop:1044 length:354 start_codon:yes stop_codon:yes gene_type:complete